MSCEHCEARLAALEAEVERMSVERDRLAASLKAYAHDSDSQRRRVEYLEAQAAKPPWNPEFWAYAWKQKAKELRRAMWRRSAHRKDDPSTAH